MSGGQMPTAMMDDEPPPPLEGEDDADDEAPPPLEPAKPVRPPRVVDPPPPLEGDQPPPSSAARARAPAAKPGASGAGGGGGMGGLKKGFLNAPAPKPRKPRAAPAPAPAEPLEVIRPKQPPAGGGGPGGGGAAAAAEAKLAGLRLDEVQEALRESAPKLSGTSSEWVTDDLLSKLQRDPVLSAGLTNPRFTQAMAEVQKDPQGAMAKYKGDAALQDFLLRFMGLMGSHFGALGEAQGQGGAGAKPPARGGGGAAAAPGGGGGVRLRAEGGGADIVPAAEREAEELAHKALADPDLRAVLEDPDVQRVLQAVQARDTRPVDPLLRSPAMAAKLQKLAAAGLLQMSWQP